MNEESMRHQERADAIADSMRRYLLSVNAGGIGTLAVLVEKKDCVLSSGRLCVPLISFALGLIFVGFSLYLQKWKALKRRDAAKKSCNTTFTAFFWQNETYDLVAFGCFIFGVFSYFYGSR